MYSINTTIPLRCRSTGSHTSAYIRQSMASRPLVNFLYKSQSQVLASNCIGGLESLQASSLFRSNRNGGLQIRSMTKLAEALTDVKKIQDEHSTKVDYTPKTLEVRYKLLHHWRNLHTINFQPSMPHMRVFLRHHFVTS